MKERLLWYQIGVQKCSVAIIGLMGVYVAWLHEWDLGDDSVFGIES